MIETLDFGSRSWAYALFILLLCLSIFFVALFGRWLFALGIPGKQFLSKSKSKTLLLLIIWPLPIAIFLIWMGYVISYTHFYSLKINDGTEIVVEYLWTKHKVNIPNSEVANVTVVHKGRGWKSSDILVITTKSGKKFQSSAPVPFPETLTNKIRESIQPVASPEN